ncbi:argininosuccinate lyase [Acidaminobacter hydrogenoformans]|uniref:Argininosuccinate lyase n=1 Tax=Acidaminobacter hydrogenoformans DSM 2784 TaxID=1120920 RepID=A0A1G5RTX6_9FIRM|nr:argininosuccinate lyase [Acidaminobacter hydrogenoformans]SCZ77534.1 argininosuccinate lyase [Acidaminobacter hydrogenoformans DSM 2784]
MKLWSGRFESGTSQLMDAFNNSIQFDHRMYKEDLSGSLAHAKMLAKMGILTEDELKALVLALKEIEAEIELGSFKFKIEDEDLHMAVEKRLTEKLGDLGKKIHTARSRNDQVALDFRLYVRRECQTIQELIRELMSVLVEHAAVTTDVIMPGYTHMQKAQPVRLAYHLLAYFEMLKRDVSRFEDAYERMSLSPLGAGALAGTSYESDRFLTAEALGFSGPSENAMDSVADRDFAIEFLSASAITMMHLSRLAEEFVIWSTGEFAFIEIGDAYATGSSIMPQKKNPDAAELIRGKSGRVYGDLMALLTVMKGLPMAYNKDMQEDKEPVFDAGDTVKLCLTVFADMLRHTTFKPEVMLHQCKQGFLNATDLADYLVKKGLPFRDAHEVSGKLVAYAIREKKILETLSLEEMQTVSNLIGEDVYEAIDIERCVENKKSYGSTSLDSVNRMLELAKAYLKA